MTLIIVQQITVPMAYNQYKHMFQTSYKANPLIFLFSWKNVTKNIISVLYVHKEETNNMRNNTDGSHVIETQMSES